jgi:DNA-binding CsgD family transcriptional regulator
VWQLDLGSMLSGQFELVDELYDTIGNGGFSRLPALIAEAIDARSCTFQVLLPSGEPVVVESTYFSDDMNRFYVEQGIYDHDVWQTVAKGRLINGRACDLAEYVSDDEYSRSRFYQDMIRHFGDDTGRCLGAASGLKGGAMMTIGLHRAFRDNAFDHTQLKAANDLLPHVARVVEAQRRFDAVNRDRAAWEAALLAMPQAALVCDQGGKVMLVNQAARAIVHRRDGLALVHGRLEPFAPAARARFQQILRGALARIDERGGALLVERAGSARPYRIVCLPLEILGRTHAMVLIDDPDRAKLGQTDLLRSFYGLTPAEAEVSVMIGAGERIETIAERRSVSVATVKSLLQRAYQKTEVNKATQLARLIAELPS